MKVSSDEFYVSGAYLKNNPTWDVADARWKASIIYKLLRKHNVEGGKVVDVGCGAGAVLKQLARKGFSAESFTGFDIAPDAIKLAAKDSDGTVHFINDDFTRVENFQADILLAIDVIEHVDDYYGFLRKLKSRSKYFIFHIPLDLCCRSLMKPHILLQQRESVGHIHYFSKEMLLWSLSDLGYTVVDYVYSKPDIDIKTPRSFKQLIKKYLRKLSFALNRELSIKLWGGYSMMILLK